MTLKYEIALVHVFWVDGGIDTRYHSNILGQQLYFENLANGNYSPLVNFNIGNNISTTITYIDKTDKDITTLIASNYAIIRETVAPGQYKYRYFFAQASQDSGRQLLVQLNLDDIQTNYFKYKNDILDCVINRASLNRFTRNGNTARFNNSPDSPLLNNELVNLPKRLTSRTAIYPGIDLTEGSKINNNLVVSKENWVIILMQPNDIINEFFNLGFEVPTLCVEQFNTGLLCLVASLSNRWIVENNAINNSDYSSGPCDFNTLISFLNRNPELLPYIVGFKITPICPFPVREYIEGTDYTVDVNGKISFTVSGLGIPYAYIGGQRKPYNGSICILSIQESNSLIYDFEIPFEIDFNIDDIKNSVRNSKYNPKLLSALAKELNIVDYAGNSFTYDIQKINSKTIRLLFNEPITVDLTKGYVRIQDIVDSVYNNGCDYNYTGLMYSNDTLIPYVVDKYADFLSQNKNYALMQQAQRDYNTEMTQLNNTQSIINGSVGVLGKLAMQNYDGVSSGLLSTGLNVGFSQAKLNATNDLSLKNQAYTIDNMRSAPGSLKNAQGSILASYLINDTRLAFFIDIYECLQQDAEKFNDHCHMYGYAYERIGKLSDFDNIRHYFNYIEATVQTVNAPISNLEKYRLTERLRGVRFWNSDNLSYELENYEEDLT